MKRLLTLLLSATMIFSLASCGSDQGTSSAEPSKESSAAESVSSKEESKEEGSKTNSDDIIINFHEHSDSEGLVDNLIDEYNAMDNGVTIVKHIIPNDDYDDKLKVLTAGASGELDVFWVRSPSQVKQYMANDALLDLTDYAKQSGLDLSPIENTTLVGAKNADGNFFGMPTTGSCWMLFYNKDLFDAKGLEYPIDLTWDEYATLSKQLTAEENGTKYWGGIIPNWTLNLGATSVGEYLTAEAPMENTRKYMEVLHKLYVEDKSNPGIAEMSAGTFDINSYFGAGNIYMMVNGDWEFNLLDVPFEYGAAPLPVFEGAEKGSTVGQSSYLCVSANSKHPQEAYDFIEFATTSDAGTSIYAKTKNVPSYSTDAALSVYKDLVKVDGVDYRFSAKINDEQGTEANYHDLNEAFKQEMELYLLDEQSVDEAFENYFSLRDESIANSAE
ncbi:ABC transporter substrate-binding protein [Scatolibacter rhodanostii]|uniref:ABC transporter substrate-binding protein n=1 Tax=Scatolibacter rhodanostii TaxID=2014781 RepID=UPI000C07F45C|nr:sugar ABC transporter substrate-binding protein [Scatolibacter rhodanostii]